MEKKIDKEGPSKGPAFSSREKKTTLSGKKGGEKIPIPAKGKEGGGYSRKKRTKKKKTLTMRRGDTICGGRVIDDADRKKRGGNFHAKYIQKQKKGGASS